jgi:glycosyltransferase involved in cell wall biosynthesis
MAQDIGAERLILLFVGKRRYTNRDALEERFGRIYQIPYFWAKSGRTTKLWLIDYHVRSYRREVHDELKVISTPVIGPHFLFRLLTEFIGLVRRRDHPRVVIASGDCYVGLLGYALSRLANATFVFDLYDDYAEFGGYRRLPGFDPLTFLLRRADLVSFASKALLDRLEHRTRTSVLVPNGIDPQQFRSLNKAASRGHLGLAQEATFVGYFGGLDADRGIEDLIDAVHLLRDQGLDIRLLVGGRSRPGLDLNRDWISYLGNVPFERVPLALACCDMLALPYRRSAYLDMASSCKIAEYIAAGRPIVATITPNFTENFPEQASELSDLLAAPGDPKSLADAIRRQLMERRLTSMPQAMEWETISESLADRIADVVRVRT